MFDLEGASVNVSVEIHVGTFSTEVTVTETGPDGLDDAVARAVSATRDLVGAEACASAASAVWVETPDA